MHNIIGTVQLDGGPIETISVSLWNKDTSTNRDSLVGSIADVNCGLLREHL